MKATNGGASGCRRVPAANEGRRTRRHVRSVRQARERGAERFAERRNDPVVGGVVERAGREREDPAAGLDRRGDLVFGVFVGRGGAQVEVADTVAVRGDLPLLRERPRRSRKWR